jgi:hypothetical protein
MKQTFGQVPDPAPVRPAREAIPQNGNAPSIKEIPYDYVARFELTGVRGNRVQDVINISTDGAFVAVAIAYSFIPTLPAPLPLVASGPIVNGDSVTFTNLSNIISNTLAKLINLRNDYTIPIKNLENALVPIIQTIIEPRSTFMHCLLTKLCGIEFKYSVVDSGSGRELQNRPIHNLSGLGKADGDRPFRPLAKPQLYLPRSTIRIEVEEVSEGPMYKGAELFFVFHGYKILGYGTGQL